MATGLGNFEVRLLNKGKWITESRGADQGATMEAANGFVAKQANEGVKVVEETYDEDAGTFHEKTVFSYLNQNDKDLAGEKAVAAARARRKGSDKIFGTNRHSPIGEKKVAQLDDDHGVGAWRFWKSHLCHFARRQIRHQYSIPHSVAGT